MHFCARMVLDLKGCQACAGSCIFMPVWKNHLCDANILLHASVIKRMYLLNF